MGTLRHDQYTFLIISHSVLLTMRNVSDRPQMTTRRMRIVCWIPKATNTHSQYVILTAFPLQQWLHGRAAMLRYTYSACINNNNNNNNNNIFIYCSWVVTRWQWLFYM